MPDMNGYEVCRQLKKTPETSDISVIFLTGKNEVEDEIIGLELGAVDYISKPISPPILLARVNNHLALAEQRMALEGLVAERTRQIEKAKDAVTYSMGALAEARDNETGNHLKRTQYYIKVLAENLALTPDHADKLTAKIIDMLVRAAPLHDIGKIGVPDTVLKKSGKLTPEEMSEMQNHTQYGRAALVKAERDIGATPYLEMAKQIAYCHHEKWDGSGYPEGLSGVNIPLPARLMAIADVYDALISKRYYKEAYTHEAAIEFIQQHQGSYFDPRIVEVFVKNSNEFRDIANRYSDKNTQHDG